jgi:hypothetical protein
MIVKDWKGYLYIATSDADWITRQQAWSKACREAKNIEKFYKTTPQPMPEKHYMFCNYRYTPVNF